MITAVLAALGAGALSTAHAAYNGQVLTSTQVPGAVLINRDCMATLIAPRVALTSANCLSDSQARNPQAAPAGWAANRPYVKFHRARDGKAFNGTYVKFTETPVASVGDLAVVAFDQDVETDADVATRIIPSYADEALGVSEPAARTGKSGAGILSATNPAFLNNRLSLVTYARDSFNADSKADGKDAKGVAVSTFNPAGILAIRRVTRNLVKGACSTAKACGETTPLQYQSIAVFKSEFADLLNPDVEAPAIGRKNQLRRLYTEFKMTDDDVDDMLIVTPYRQQGNSSPPFAPGDQGAGLFGVGPGGREYLVGIASDNTTQVRLSHYWPWVYRTIQKLVEEGFLPDGDRLDGDRIAERVLNASPTPGGYSVEPLTLQGNVWIRACTRVGMTMYSILNRDKTYWVGWRVNFPGRRTFYRSTAVEQKEDGSSNCVGSTVDPHSALWQIGRGDLPDKIIGGTEFRSWEEDRLLDPKIGEIYLGNKGGYRLLQGLSSGREKLAPLPDQVDNKYWKYLGTGADARILKYQFGFPQNEPGSTRRWFEPASALYQPNLFVGQSGVGVTRLYSACSYQNSVVALPEGRYTRADFAKMSFPIETLASIRTDKGYQITMYSGENFDGKHWTAGGDIVCGPKYYGNVVPASVVVSRWPDVTLYMHGFYGGTSIKLQPGRYTAAQLSAMGLPRKSLSSLKVKEGSVANLYEGDNFTGRNRWITQDEPWLGDSDFNDAMSSVIIY